MGKKMCVSIFPNLLALWQPNNLSLNYLFNKFITSEKNILVQQLYSCIARLWSEHPLDAQHL